MQVGSNKPYYGWYVLAGVSGVNFANGATTIGVLSVFVLPLAEEFGWSRTEIAAATTIGALLGATIAPFTGRLNDRFGGRLPLAIAAILVIVAMLGLASVQSLLWFYAAFGLARLADQGLVQAVSPPAVSRWFDRYLGRANAIVFLASSAGGMLLPLIVQAIISLQGWREAWAMLAAQMALLGLLPVLMLVRRRPEDMGLRMDGADAVPKTPRRTGYGQPEGGEARSLTLGEALRSTGFWLLTIAALLLGVASTGVSLHIVPYLVESGVQTGAAVGTVSVTFLASGISVLSWGYVADRYSYRWILVGSAALKTASIALLLVTDTLPEAYAFAIVHGVTEAAFRTLLIVSLADFFGRRYLGSIFGVNKSVQVLGMAAGPLVSAAVFDATQQYFAAFAAFIAVGSAATLLLILARPTRKPA
jgi:MFS family permease